MSKTFFGGIIAGAVITLVIFLFIARPERDTPEGIKADAVIAAYPAKQDSAAARDSVITELRDTIALVARERSRWHDSVSTLLQHVDSLHQVADTTGTLEPGLSTQDTIFRLARALEIQKQLTTKYRDETVPALLHQIQLDSIQLALADSTIRHQVIDRRILQQDLDSAIVVLGNLRNATKPGPHISLPVLGDIYIKDVAIAAVSYCIGGGAPC